MSGSPETPVQLAELNASDGAAFLRVVGPVFENSPWIAERSWAQRPFSSLETLHEVLSRTVRDASPEEQLQLIRAHPDLVGRAARAGALTPESTREQAAAGLGGLSPEEIGMFERSNEAYTARFGFPFVICARENRKDAILQAFPVRLGHSRAEEIETALREIAKIAWLRLRDRVVA